MHVEDYGEWTVVTYADGKVEYLQGLHEIPFCSKYAQYYWGTRIAFIDFKNGVIMDCPHFVGRPTPRVEIESFENSFNTSDFLEEQLKIAQRERSRKRSIP